MVSKCANPGCSASFRYFREGRLFEIEVSAAAGKDPSQRKPHRKVEYFWLCSSCATKLTVKADGERGAVTVPLAGTTVRQATA